MLLRAITHLIQTPDSLPIAKANVVRSGNIPWIEVAIDTEMLMVITDPITVYLTESGSVPIPKWASYIDVIALGRRRRRHKSLLARTGEGGYAGKFVATTWERGVHFDTNTHTVEFTCGAGGAGGATLIRWCWGGAGSAFTITGQTITAAGGAGGTALLF